MPLKYGAYVIRIPNCPPSRCQPCNREAFRFVFGDVIDEKSFVPVALKSPERRFEDDRQRCLAHALSFFTTEESAIARYCQLKETHSQIGKAIGDHLAKGQIESQDGIATAAKKGHFTFFEEEGCNFAERFQVVRELPK